MKMLKEISRRWGHDRRGRDPRARAAERAVTPPIVLAACAGSASVR
jgi:hypothetical protein